MKNDTKHAKFWYEREKQFFFSFEIIFLSLISNYFLLAYCDIDMQLLALVRVYDKQ